MVNKTHKCIFFLRTLKKNHLSSVILGNFFHCIDSILTRCITVWELLSVTSKSPAKGGENHPMHYRHSTSCHLGCPKEGVQTARNIVKNTSQPAHKLFALLLSGRSFRCQWPMTNRLRNSFSPKTVSLLNYLPHWPCTLLKHLQHITTDTSISTYHCILLYMLYIISHINLLICTSWTINVTYHIYVYSHTTVVASGNHNHYYLTYVYHYLIPHQTVHKLAVNPKETNISCVAAFALLFFCCIFLPCTCDMCSGNKV